MNSSCTPRNASPAAGASWAATSAGKGVCGDLAGEKHAQRGDGVLLGDEARQKRRQHAPIAQPHERPQRLKIPPHPGQDARGRVAGRQARKGPHASRGQQDDRASLLDERARVVPNEACQRASRRQMVQREFHDRSGRCLARHKAAQDEAQHSDNAEVRGGVMCYPYAPRGAGRRILRTVRKGRAKPRGP